MDNHQRAGAYFTACTTLGVGKVLAGSEPLWLEVTCQFSWSFRTPPERCRMGDNADVSFEQRVASLNSSDPAYDHRGYLDSNSRNAGWPRGSPRSHISHCSQFNRHSAVLVCDNFAVTRLGHLKWPISALN